MAHSVSTNGRLSSWTGRRAGVGSARLRLLVVDDNPNAAYALVAYLSLEDIECTVAFGGKEAVVSAMTCDPHVVLMDISMPECNGYEAARTLRHHPKTRDVVIVAHTAPLFEYALHLGPVIDARNLDSRTTAAQYIAEGREEGTGVEEHAADTHAATRPGDALRDILDPRTQ